MRKYKYIIITRLPSSNFLLQWLSLSLSNKFLILQQPNCKWFWKKKTKSVLILYPGPWRNFILKDICHKDRLFQLKLQKINLKGLQSSFERQFIWNVPYSIDNNSLQKVSWQVKVIKGYLKSCISLEVKDYVLLGGPQSTVQCTGSMIGIRGPMWGPRVLYTGTGLLQGTKGALCGPRVLYSTGFLKRDCRLSVWVPDGD